MSLPNDCARCDGVNCPLRDECARYVAYCEDDGGPRTPYMHSMPDGCETFIEADSYYGDDVMVRRRMELI